MDDKDKKSSLPAKTEPDESVVSTNVENDESITATKMERKESSLPTLQEFNAKLAEGAVKTDIKDAIDSKTVAGGDLPKLTKSSLKSTFVSKKDDDVKKTSGGIKIELTAKQKQEIKEAFVVLDVGGTGYMATHDLKIALRAMGFEPRKNEIKKIAEKVDKNNTGKLCFTDFMEVVYLKLAEKDTRDEIYKAFTLFDKERTGFITFENLRQVAIELGEGLNDEEIKEMIDEADMDNDGAVNQDEFFRIMKKTSLY